MRPARSRKSKTTATPSGSHSRLPLDCGPAPMANTTNRTSRTDEVLAVLVPGMELTDAEIVAEIIGRVPERHRGQIIPARGKLVVQGRVELAGLNAAGHKIWRRTPEDRIDAAREEAAGRKELARENLRKQKLSPKQIDERVQKIAAYLDNESINKALREQMERGRSWRNARARANEAKVESDAKRRERKRELRQAERDQDAYLDFLKIHDALRDAVGDLLAVRGFMQTEIERQERGEVTKIPAERWPLVGSNVFEVIAVSGALWHDMATALGHPPEHCPLCGGRTERPPDALSEGYDADADVADDDLIDGEEGG